MALTILIEGKGVVANADAIADSAGGTWSEQGGGTIALSEDVFLIGASCLGGKYAGKSGFQQYDIGAGNELDFSSGGTEEGQLMYFWVSMTALGTLDTLSTFPLCIRISSDSPGTSNYVDYLIAGNDDKNGWSGGFKCFVIDPSLIGSRVSGTQASIIAAIRTMGVWIDCSGSARADSIFTDVIAVGSGLRITGTSTTAWQDIVDYCTAYSVRGWGMFQEREGIAYGYGTTIIGDTTNQIAAVDFSDSARVIQYGISEYYESGAWKSSFGPDAFGIIIEDHTSYDTDFSNTNVSIAGSVNTSHYIDSAQGTNFSFDGGSISRANNNSSFISGHSYDGTVFGNCEEINPNGGTLTNCVIGSTLETVTGAVALTAATDLDVMSNLIFNAYTGKYALYIPATVTGTISLNNFVGDGSGTDVYWAATSGTLTINKSNGTNFSTWLAGGTATVSLVASVSIDIHVEDQSAADLVGALVYVDEDLEAAGEIINTVTNATGDVSTSYSGADTSATVRIRKYGYKPYIGTISLASDTSLNVTLITDPQQT